MESSFIHRLSHPKLENPVLVEGLPGFGNVGSVSAQLLIESYDAKLFAEYYSPFFPDYVTVDKHGVCSPPRYEFYASNSKNTDLMILTGDSQPSLDNVVAHYEICEEILDFAQEFGCGFVVTVGGVPIADRKKDVYVAATSNELAADVMAKGAIIYGKGRIMGATGLLLCLAKERGLDGLCLLGSTEGLSVDKTAGMAVFKLLSSLFERGYDGERPEERKD